MPDTHHLAKPELRKRIREMLASGMTQAAIARQLHKSVSTIAFHVRNLGIEPKEYATPDPIVRGKRRCSECGKSKTLGAFPTHRVAVCSVCRRSRRKG
jgi:IS30 family transposase